MISIYLIISLLATHFVADFVFQTDKMALGKSKEWKWLVAHTSLYSFCFLWAGVWFSLCTFLLHTATDYVTSRATSKLWFITMEPRELLDGWFYGKLKDGYRHWFFVCIGADQLIHGVTLLLTWKLLHG